MASFLSPEQKQLLGPLLQIIVFILAVLGGIAVNTVLGGPKVPVISEFAGMVLGVVAFFVLLKELRK